MINAYSYLNALGIHLTHRIRLAEQAGDQKAVDQLLRRKDRINRLKAKLARRSRERS